MILFDEQKTDGDLPITLENRDLLPAKIKVIGVGGGGGNAVNRMIDAQLRGVEFIPANADLQALAKCRAPTKIQLGKLITRGLGAGADPDVGRKAALEDSDRILEYIEGSDMIFLAAGLGGGSSSAPLRTRTRQVEHRPRPPQTPACGWLHSRLASNREKP